jgi:hypothetical protein
MDERFICDMSASRIRFDVKSGSRRDLLSDRFLAPRSTMSVVDVQKPGGFLKDQKLRVFGLFLQTR